MHCKKLVIHVESHASAVSARERRIALYQSDEQQNVVFDSSSQMGLVLVTAIQQGGQFSSVGDILSVLFNGDFSMGLL